jgi:hypothetical protein
MRTFFLLYTGQQGAPFEMFAMFRLADPTLSLISLIALCLYLRQLRYKFTNIDEVEFDYFHFKKGLFCKLWTSIVLIGLYWGTFYTASIDTKNLAYGDFAISLLHPIVFLLMLYQGVGLINELHENFHPYHSLDKPILKGVSKYEWRQIPGVHAILTMIVLQCTFIFARLVLLSLPDIAKLSKIDSI